MNRIVPFLLCFVLFLSLHSYVHAQKKGKDVPMKGYMPTENIKFKKDDRNAKHMPERKEYWLIYKTKSGSFLYGNPCMTEQTHKMGFEYMLQPKNIPWDVGFRWRAANNIWVNMKLCVTRTPFWRLMLHKRTKKCRTKTGDFAG